SMCACPLRRPSVFQAHLSRDPQAPINPCGKGDARAAYRLNAGTGLVRLRSPPATDSVYTGNRLNVLLHPLGLLTS
ncbi:hypothetical protein BaRGS_00031285, partial [Batillaria attramentaria]